MDHPMALTLQSILAPLSNALFPPMCRHCGDKFVDGLSNILCMKCFESVPSYREPCCTHCGLGLPQGGFEGIDSPRCKECGDDDCYLDQVAAYGPYEGPLRLAHHAFKFEGMEHLAEILGARMAGCMVRLAKADVLVPVPLRPERERERGYHPARLLALEIARATGLPVVELLQKSKPTPAQVSLDRSDRLRNLKGAFENISKAPIPSRVVLVDDVYTTGGTLEECAGVLKRAGVEWAGAVVLGRTERRAGLI